MVASIRRRKLFQRRFRPWDQRESNTSNIFVSYRREDSAGYTGRLYDRLSRHFGKDQVFMDVDHIEPGEDFIELINEKIRVCCTLVVLIGRNWVSAVDKNGARRLDNPEDFVRLEITAALAANVRVMPVLVGGASMPDARDLPEPLVGLCRRQAAEVFDTRFHQDVDRLIESIEKGIRDTSAPVSVLLTHDVEPKQDVTAHYVNEKPSESSASLLGSLRSKIRQRVTWIAPLLFLAIVGLWSWDAYHRPHYEYYANVILRWGLPEGIGHLKHVQIRHRNVVLKFIKKGRKGPIDEIRVVNSGDRYLPAPVSPGATFALVGLMPLARETRSGPLTLPTAMVARRLVFERSNNGRILAQRAYNASDRLLYTLQYIEPNVAKFGEGPFTKAILQSGITHLQFVHATTGPELGRTKKMLFMDGSGRPKPDEHGSYGLQFAFDSRGRIVAEMTLDEKGNPAPNNLGISKWVIAYDEPWGNIIGVKNLDRDDRSVADSSGVAEMTMRYEVYGNLQQLALFGKDGRLVVTKGLGAAARTFLYDTEGNLVENAFLDANQKLVRGALGFAKQKVVWDKQGRSLESYFGPDDMPMLVAGIFMIRATWGERGNIVNAQFFNEHNQPTRDSEGCSTDGYRYDDRGNLTEQTCYDETGRPVRNLSGWAKVKITSDERGNAIEKRYFGPDGKPGLYEERVVRVVLNYNEQERQTEEAYFDSADRPVRNKSGTARINYEYNAQGKLIRISFFDESGRPTRHKDGYAVINRVYDARGNMREENLFDPEGNRTIHTSDGFSRIAYEYDDRGNRTDALYLDKNGQPTLHTQGFARVRNKYNEKGRITEQVFLGLDNSPATHRKGGYAKRRWTFDEGGKVSHVSYYDTNDRLMGNSYGYATIRYLHDSLGREIKREFFDANDVPVRTGVTIDEIEPESSAQRAGLQVLDQIIAYDGRDVPDTRVFEELELFEGERRRELRIQRGDKLLSIDVPPGRLEGLKTIEKISRAGRKADA